MQEPSGTHPFAPFEWMLSLRYLRARRKEGFISVIAGFSFVGIMLGVATLIIVMAVMNGFRQELLQKILGLNGHLLIQPLESPLTDWQALADRISKVPGIRLAAPLPSTSTSTSSRLRWQPLGIGTAALPGAALTFGNKNVWRAIEITGLFPRQHATFTFRPT